MPDQTCPNCGAGVTVHGQYACGSGYIMAQVTSTICCLSNQLADEKSSHQCTLEASLDYRDRCFTAEAEVTRLRGLLGEIQATVASDLKSGFTIETNSIKRDNHKIRPVVFAGPISSVLSRIDQPKGDSDD